MRGDVRKRTNAAFGLPLDNGLDASYDTIMMGHWHQTIFTPYLIVNGSVKGLDEYAASINVRQEGPAQWLFNVHPKFGIIWPNPIYSDLEEPMFAPFEVLSADDQRTAAKYIGSLDREPDLTIAPDGNPYLYRWFIVRSTGDNSVGTCISTCRLPMIPSVRCTITRGTT